MVRKSSAWIVGLCLIGLSLAGWSQQARAQEVTTCADVCELFPLDPVKVACLGAGLEEMGYPVDATALCSVVLTTEMCLACYGAISPSDDHCVAAYAVCSLLQGIPTTAPATAPTVGVTVPTTGADACGVNGNCTCPGGQMCTHNCPAGHCEMTCAGGANCTLNCPGGGCEMACAGGANCSVNCPGGGCTAECASGAFCTTNCPGGECDSSCAMGANCSMNCPNGVRCGCEGEGCP